MSILRRNRRKAEKKASKKGLTESLKLVEAIKTMREAGAIKIDYEKHEVQIQEELFWKDRSEAFRDNWARGFAAYLDGIQGRDPDAPGYVKKELKLISLETGELLKIY